MQIEIRKANSHDWQLLTNLDKRMFSKTDRFEIEDWKDFRCFLIFLNNRLIGSVALKHNFTVDKDDNFIPSKKTLYIGSTGILPAFQRKGFGLFIKAWEVAYARYKGFKKIETTVRKSNKKIISLNKKFGFRVTKIFPEYYECPNENALTMELIIS